ncbi:PREDICTED: pentatricopeptide repeat-containing protein MRL1, chloroplastic isoform X2 [Tarenaya hassleriana]|uniref:pentatricopeptide repeat-containing protein MRL1, chloroplastic isoform X2 n=1 Tax=Tarenaya hassleriana TaxID=28532 RepID=UPI00053C59BB|nr:PREDICTED: pentatricopeptide repeat-containing protein MRL1, chloroplastic isoform X2 [Tarenaya hassleriana]
METGFISVRSSETLTLAAFSPAILPAASFRSSRREFLGRCHSLRPPGGFHLRTRARIRKSGWNPTRSPPFVVRASLDTGLILVVVAVTAFSAAAFAYCQRGYRKRKNSSEVSASPDATIHGGITEEQLEIELSDGGDIQKGIPVETNGVLDAKIDNLEEKLDQIPEHAAMQDDSVLTKPSDSTPDNSHFTVSSVVMIANEHNNVDQPIAASTLSGSVALQSVLGGEKDAENQVETNEQKMSLDFDLSKEMVGTHSIASPLMVEDSKAVEHEHNDLPQKPFAYNIPLESPRKELHAFYGPTLSVAESPSVTSLKAVSPSFVSSSTEISSPHHNVLGMMDVQVSGQSSVESAGGEKIPVEHGKGASVHKKTEVRRDRRFQRHDDARHVVNQTDKSTPRFPNRNGALTNGNSHPQRTLDAYNRLLREGRLKECISLLEDWEQKDLLDMDKIHHASFFKICKKKKAAKEAFRFIKLVPNPTLSTFNMLMSVCSSSQDIKGAREVLQLVQESGMIADCKLYTTLISTCAKSGKVDAMFEVFHQMANSGVEPNLHTFGALIDGCARAGQVAKAFGAYGILRSKDVQPDRVVFNALISACGKAGAVDRAFDVLAEMQTESHPIDPDHVTIGALMTACFNSGQVERAKEVYKMMHEYGIRGTPEVYTIAVNSCSKSGDWEFACNIYNDMKEKGVTPDEVFFSALIDVAGHAGMLDNAFDVLQDARSQGIRVGSISYSSLMGACCNAKNWQKALELYEKIKSIKLRPTVSTMNALITALCDGDQLPKALEILDEIKGLDLTPNTVTYSMLMLASERKDDLEVSFMLLSRAKEDGVSPNLIMCRSITSMCVRRFEKASSTGEPVLSFKSGRPQIENNWTSMALMVYRETILSGIVPTAGVVSQVLGCLRIPHDTSLRDRLIENLGLSTSSQRQHNLFSLVDGFGEYDPRAFSLLEEATSLGVLPSVSFNKVPILFDSTELSKNIAEVYLLTILKGLKHRLAADAKLPHVTVIISMEEKQIVTPEGEKTTYLVGRAGQEIVAILRRLGISHNRKDSSGKIRISGASLKKWFQPKLASPFIGQPGDLKSSQVRLGNQIFHQQRSIRTGNLSLE